MQEGTLELLKQAARLPRRKQGRSHKDRFRVTLRNKVKGLDLSPGVWKTVKGLFKAPFCCYVDRWLQWGQERPQEDQEGLTRVHLRVTMAWIKGAL